MEVCPLCRKKIIPVQINYEEQLLMCESEDCLGPFTTNDCIYIPNQVTVKVSEDPKIIEMARKETEEGIRMKSAEKVHQVIPVSTELSLYTPPVTPSPPVAKTGIHNYSKPSHSKTETYTSQESMHLIKEESNEKNPPRVKSIFDVDGLFDIPLKKVSKKEKNPDNDLDNDKKVNSKDKSLLKKPKIRKIEVTNINVKKLKQDKKVKIEENKTDGMLNINVDTDVTDNNLPKNMLDDNFSEIFDSLISSNNVINNERCDNYNSISDNQFKVELNDSAVNLDVNNYNPIRENQFKVELNDAVVNLDDFDMLIENTVPDNSAVDNFLGGMEIASPGLTENEIDIWLNLYTT